VQINLQRELNASAAQKLSLFLVMNVRARCEKRALYVRGAAATLEHINSIGCYYCCVCIISRYESVFDANEVSQRQIRCLHMEKP
jgi:hypothetical protein